MLDKYTYDCSPKNLQKYGLTQCVEGLSAGYGHVRVLGVDASGSLWLQLQNPPKITQDPYYTWKQNRNGDWAPCAFDANALRKFIPEIDSFKPISKLTPSESKIPKTAFTLQQLCADYIKNNHQRIIFFGIPDLGKTKYKYSNSLMTYPSVRIQKLSSTQVACETNHEFFYFNAPFLEGYFAKIQEILELSKIIILPATSNTENEKPNNVQEFFTAFTGQELLVALHKELEKQTKLDLSKQKLNHTVTTTIKISKLLQAAVKQTFPTYNGYQDKEFNIVYAYPEFSKTPEPLHDISENKTSLPILSQPMTLKININHLYYFEVDPIDIDCSSKALEMFGYSTPLLGTKKDSKEFVEQRLLIGTGIEPLTGELVLWFADSPRFNPYSISPRNVDFVNPFEDYNTQEVSVDYIRQMLHCFVIEENAHSSNFINNALSLETPSLPPESNPQRSTPTKPSQNFNNNNNQQASQISTKPAIKPLSTLISNFIRANLEDVIKEGVRTFGQHKAIFCPPQPGEKPITEPARQITLQSHYVSKAIIPDDLNRDVAFKLLKKTLLNYNLIDLTIDTKKSKKNQTLSLKEEIQKRQEKFEKIQPGVEVKSTLQLKEISDQQTDIMNFLKNHQKTLLPNMEKNLYEIEETKIKRKYTKSKNNSKTSEEPKKKSRKSTTPETISKETPQTTTTLTL